MEWCALSLFILIYNVRSKENITVVGVRTEYCVDTTCRRALSLGYQVTLIADGHTTIDDILPAKQIIEHHNINLSKLSAADCKIAVVSSSEHVF
ncbi:isochorismatase family protein [Lysinibacillus endophyticus]|uniref:isochorismatase family protein n=1 Tax=Ureibacillus endophyticus TaxID=1978490 RepID=UPI002646D546|nr:isochorismatase family protein [Lysinibacillus endophyticus]